MQFPKLSPSNQYVDVDGVPTPVEDIVPKEPEAVPEESDEKLTDSKKK